MPFGKSFPLQCKVDKFFLKRNYFQNLGQEDVNYKRNSFYFKEFFEHGKKCVGLFDGVWWKRFSLYFAKGAVCQFQF